MCGDEDQPSPEAYKRNMAQPMPRSRKVKLVLRNLSRRIYPRPSNCCGNYGEPGC